MFFQSRQILTFAQEKTRLPNGRPFFCPALPGRQLAQAKRDRLLGKGRDRKKEAGELFGKNHSKEEVLSQCDKTYEKPPHNTQKQVAKQLGWSTGKGRGACLPAGGFAFDRRPPLPHRITEI